MARIASDLAERFWTKVDRGGPDDCWLKQGVPFTNGYGAFKFGEKTVKAHRMAWWLTYGVDSIPEGQQLRHLCEGRYAPGDLTYKRCCNPAHLALGSAKDNADDRDRNGRQVAKHGENRAFAKLTETAIHQIRLRFVAGTGNQYDLAAEYGVSQRLISQIVRYEAWTHVRTEGAPPIFSRRTYSADELADMRQLRHEGHSYQVIADRFGIKNTGTVYRLIHPS